MQEYFKNKKVIITGHTGFKGSWLSLWMSMLGAEVSGISISIPTNPSHFELLNLKIKNDIRVDIYNSKKIEDIISRIKPDYVFHLAAQPLVALSYQNPLETFQTNVVGTANLLEALRELKNECIAVIITSDKSYDNLEISRGYHEDDKLGGSDPYSGSKGAAELVINSYTKSFFIENNIRIGVGRAGNVIGGGDWAKDRIVPDCIRSWSINQSVKIRNPNSTRPWQHVFEPLSGYLSLAEKLTVDSKINGEAYNFGPPANQNHTVDELIIEMNNYWHGIEWQYEIEKGEIFHEASLLKLNCDKALFDLNWVPTLNFEQTVKMTMEWYKEFYENESSNMLQFSNEQIDSYMGLAVKNNL